MRTFLPAFALLALAVGLGRFSTQPPQPDLRPVAAVGAPADAAGDALR